MIAAASRLPVQRDGVSLLVVDPAADDVALTAFAELSTLLRADDIIVVNDAATVPASLRGRDAAGHPIEVRLYHHAGGTRFGAVLFGEGDWRQPTETRPAPPPQAMGTRLVFGADSGRPLTCDVVGVSPYSERLLELDFAGTEPQVWAALYRVGELVQYSYLAEPLPLWALQNTYAARPWAFEMPSAGRPLTWSALERLRQAGIGLATVTHAAGLSSTGEAALDRRLPFPERFSIPQATVAAVNEAHRRGGRVIAVGTTVVRALEGAHVAWGRLRAGSGMTDLRLEAGSSLAVVDGVLSGVHLEGESHFELLAAFAPRALLRRAVARAERKGLRAHELGDSLLVARGVLGALHTKVPQAAAQPAA